MLGDALGAGTLDSQRQMFLLSTVDRCSVKEFPPAWIPGLRRQIRGTDIAVRLAAVALVRSRGIAGLDGDLERIAASSAEPDVLRTLALSALLTRQPQLREDIFEYLLGKLRPDVDATVRLAAAQVLGRAELGEGQLAALAKYSRIHPDPLIMPSLLDAFRKAKDPAVRDAFIKPLEAQRQQAELARTERLRKLLPLLDAGGDIGRGRRIFFGEKAGCSGCHTIGPEGGHVGPDLTAVGAVRSGHDLLEAIVFPSASFVPGFEIYRVETANDVYSGVLGRPAPGVLSIVTGPNDEVRIPRGKIVKMESSQVSFMPDGFDEVLNATELADLLTFLRAQVSRQAAMSRSD